MLTQKHIYNNNSSLISLVIYLIRNKLNKLKCLKISIPEFTLKLFLMFKFSQNCYRILFIYIQIILK